LPNGSALGCQKAQFFETEQHGLVTLEIEGEGG